MSWFDDLKQALPAYYPPTSPSNIVGYLRGSVDPNVWRSMERAGRHQMLILGSAPPNIADWVAAGVSARGSDQIVTISNLNGFIVLYGGFVRRPWGQLHIMTADGLRSFPTQIASLKRNYLPPKP